MPKTITIEIPENIKIPKEELENRIKQELALRLYEKGLVSFGQARRISGLSKWEFLELLRKEKIPISYDEEELEEDLRVIERL